MLKSYYKINKIYMKKIIVMFSVFSFMFVNVAIANTADSIAPESTVSNVQVLTDTNDDADENPMLSIISQELSDINTGPLLEQAPGDVEPLEISVDTASVVTPVVTTSRRSSSGSMPRLTQVAGQVLGAEAFNFTLNLKLGSRGNEVVELQKVLIEAGLLKISAPTGYFGPLTLKAVKDYQTSNGLKGDGFIGPLTREVLNK
jgi:hypothetical protein